METEIEELKIMITFLIIISAVLFAFAYLGEQNKKEQKIQNETMQNLIIENEKMKMLLEGKE